MSSGRSLLIKSKGSENAESATGTTRPRRSGAHPENGESEARAGSCQQVGAPMALPGRWKGKLQGGNNRFEVTRWGNFTRASSVTALAVANSAYTALTLVSVLASTSHLCCSYRSFALRDVHCGGWVPWWLYRTVGTQNSGQQGDCAGKFASGLSRISCRNGGVLG